MVIVCHVCLWHRVTSKQIDQILARKLTRSGCLLVIIYVVHAFDDHPLISGDMQHYWNIFCQATFCTVCTVQHWEITFTHVLAVVCDFAAPPANQLAHLQLYIIFHYYVIKKNTLKHKLFANKSPAQIAGVS